MCPIHSIKPQEVFKLLPSPLSTIKMAAKKNNTNNAPASSDTPATTPATVVPADAVVVPSADVPVTPTATTTDVDDVNTRLQEIQEKAQKMIAFNKEIITAVKLLQKEVARLQKASGRKARHNKAASANASPDDPSKQRKPSGFAKPTLVSKELCDFLGVPTDRMLARTEVTRLLNKYIKDNNLQDPVDRRTIRPDGKLQTLLNIKGDAQLKYFNMQSYIKHHFIKCAEGSVAPAVSS